MPFYIYKCTDCNIIFDKMRKIKERNDKTECPKCGESNSERQFDPSAGSIIMWRDPGTTRATTSGPTRKNRYTVGDIADEKNWWGKWGIKEPAHKSQRQS